MRVPLLDLKAQYATLRAELEPAVLRVMASQGFILGPEVEACERALAAYCGVPHAVGVASGTDALLVALMAEGIGPGDEVITSPYTFFATAGSIARLGARPVFVDIDPVTFQMDVTRVEAAVTPRTRALMPVHLFGQCTDMDPLLTLAGTRGLAVIEDAAQAIGAEYKGRRAGSMGDYGCFSFFPSKNLGGAGDGGVVTLRDEARRRKVAMLRVHGMEPKYYHQLVGGNFRLDALQAAVVAAKLPHLDGWTAARQRNAQRYERLFAAAGVGADDLHLPRITSTDGGRHVVNQYVVRARDRDALLSRLKAADIGCEVYYPVPMHRQPCFAYLGHAAGAFPESERAAAETLALPIYPELTDDMAAYVVETIAAFYRRA
jgi:dTDP-4-amino-4,6-dideoxygalactose transaminase